MECCKKAQIRIWCIPTARRCYSCRMIKRTDRLTAFHVDLCIALVGVQGIASAARELFQLGLPIELARRVLLHPDQRRGAAAMADVHRPTSD